MGLTRVLFMAMVLKLEHRNFGFKLNVGMFKGFMALLGNHRLNHGYGDGRGLLKNKKSLGAWIVPWLVPRPWSSHKSYFLETHPSPWSCSTMVVSVLVLHSGLFMEHSTIGTMASVVLLLTLEIWFLQDLTTKYFQDLLFSFRNVNLSLNTQYEWIKY